MNSAFRNAFRKFSFSSLYRRLNPNPTFSPLLVPLHTSITCTFHGDVVVRSPSATQSYSPCHSMAGGETHAPLSSSFSAPMEKQFDHFRHHLEESGSLRDRIRAVASEIESANRLMHSFLLLVHQSRPVPEVLEKAKAQIGVLKDLFGRLAEIISECPGQYYRYHGDWKSETQAVVSMLAFMHWLETGTLLIHTEAEEKLALNKSEFGLDIEDYLVDPENCTTVWYIVLHRKVGLTLHHHVIHTQVPLLLKRNMFYVQ